MLDYCWKVAIVVGVKEVYESLKQKYGATWMTEAEDDELAVLKEAARKAGNERLVSAIESELEAR